MSGVVVLRQVYRSGFWQGVAVAWVLFVAFNVWDVGRRGWPTSGIVGLVVLAIISVGVYVVSLRAVVIADDAGVEMRNPSRTIWLPWNAITDIDATDALRIHVGKKRYRAWAVTRGGALSGALRGSSRRPVGRRGELAEVPAEPTPTSPPDVAVMMLTTVWQQARTQTTGEVRVRWAWPEAVVLVALCGVLVLVSSAL